MKLYISASLNALADSMISEIHKKWTDPFVPPVVLFADSKMEQWFKFNWLKKHTEKSSVLMNLPMERLESFLYKAIEKTSENSTKTRNLNISLLRDLIYTKLISKENDKYFFETLESEEVKNYLTDSDGAINYLRLYDFSSQMASLFIDYEITRPAEVTEGNCGIINAWKKDKDYFGKENEAEEKWQRKLYNSLLAKNKCVTKDGMCYRTLSEFIEDNKESDNGKIKFNADSSIPVFIFGFSAIGQNHRNIVKQFAENHELYIFQQTTSNSQESKNELVKNLAGFGSKTAELWNCEIKEIKSDFEKDSLLHSLQSDISNNRKCSEYQQDDSISVTPAPSRLREVESLHTKICTLLKDNKSDLSDILVLSPSLSEYKTSIIQVFGQNETGDKEFPSIPFRISDYSAKNSLVAEAAEILFDILNKGYLCRSDVFSLAKNNYVQHVLGVNGDAVMSWSSWAASLNIYRDREFSEDWKKAKNRLLVARLSESTVIIGDEQYEPYSNLETEDNNLLYKFIELIDTLQDWVRISRKKEISLEDLNEIQNILNKLLLSDYNLPESLRGENIVYECVTDEIKNLKTLFEFDFTTTLPTRCVSLSILNSACSASFSSGAAFTKGITFLNFKANRIMTAKYVFMLGMDSKSFPGREHKNVLDLRKDKKLPGDDQIIERNKNAFFCQLLSAEDGFYISYVNKNLQKDEDYYKSSVLNVLSKYSGIKESDSVPIDETRDWTELFTSREFRNKKNFVQLQDAKKSDETSVKKENATDNEAVTNLPSKVYASSIKKFLTDPFQYFVSKVFPEDEDTGIDEVEFEPLAFDNSFLEIECAKLKLNDELDEEELRQILKNRNELPDRYFGDMTMNVLMEKSDHIVEGVEIKMGNHEFCFGESRNMSLIYENSSWVLTGQTSWFNTDFESCGQLILVDINSTANVFTAYISALMIIGSLKDKKKSKIFDVTITSVSRHGKETDNWNFTLCKTEALEYLNRIYEAMFDKEKFKDKKRYTRSLPINYLYSGDAAPEDLSQYAEKLKGGYGGRNAYWKYFDKSKIFDPKKHIGYTEEKFTQEFQQAVDDQLRLIKYLVKEEAK